METNYIALVEDNADNRMLIKALLSERYEIAEYETGAEALDGFRKRRPALVLLDISLPRMSGSDVLRAIRADPGLADLPVIAVTAHAMAGDRERFLGEGFDDYITKPILDEDELVACIEKQLGSRH